MAQVEILSHWSKLFESFETSSLDFYNAVIIAANERGLKKCKSSKEDFYEGGIFSAQRTYLRIRHKRIAYDICAAPYGTGFFFSSWMIKLHTNIGIWIFLSAVVFSYFLSRLTMEVINMLPMDKMPFLPPVLMLFGSYLLLIIGLMEFLALILFLGYLINIELIPGEDSILMIPILGSIYAAIYHPVTYYKTDTALMFQATIHSVLMQVIKEVTSAKGVRPLTELEQKPIMKDFLGK
jgi:hypothetical protein